jgi:hypothetical protein
MDKEIQCGYPHLADIPKNDIHPTLVPTFTIEF